MLFLTPLTLLTTMGIDSTPDHIMAAQAALESATLCLASDLRSDFDAVVGQTDTFMPSCNDPNTKLKLVYGFVSSATPPVVTQYSSYEDIATFMGTTIMPFANTDPLLTASALLTANCVFDYDKGIVQVNNVWIRGMIITVVYNSGFGADAKDPTLYDRTLVPSWLVTLANLRARIDLSAHPAFSETKAVYNPKSLEEQYGTICAKKSRYAPNAILAV